MHLARKRKRCRLSKTVGASTVLFELKKNLKLRMFITGTGYLESITVVHLIYSRPGEHLKEKAKTDAEAKKRCCPIFANTSQPSCGHSHFIELEQERAHHNTCDHFYWSILVGWKKFQKKIGFVMAVVQSLSALGNWRFKCMQRLGYWSFLLWDTWMDINSLYYG